MAEPNVPAGLQVVWGARVDIERGYRLEVIAMALSADIAELREDGGLPDHVHTRIAVLPQHRLLEIRVEGLSVETDPDRATSREVMNTLFELAIYRTMRSPRQERPMPPRRSRPLMCL